jgi:glycerate 2-kinase
MDPKAFLRSLFDAAVARAQPSHVIGSYLPSPPPGRTVVVGAGKAAAAMALAVDDLWPRHAPLEGVVVTRYGHIPARARGAQARIDILEAAHPVPDAAGLAASQRMLDALRGLTADDLVLVLISGGASALLTLPAYGLSLEQKQQINRALLASGAPIDEMNCVRKHLSRIKGGRLALACGKARVVTLAISDVPGDDLAVIGSGPTVADETTCADALALLRRYRIEVPSEIHHSLAANSLETPKPGDTAFARAEAHVIAAPRQSLEAAEAVARAAGVDVHVLGDAIEGESWLVGRHHAVLAQDKKSSQRCVLLSGGETTVTIWDPGAGGRGGRASEFCLGLAQALEGREGVWGLAADTDGIDGIEANAGAFVGPDTLRRAVSLGLCVDEHLARNDAYGFFSRLGDLIVTGPTHTNVNDFRAILIM